MQDWNVVVMVYGRAFSRTIALLQDHGPVSRTGFFNVLVMWVDDIQAFLAKLAERVTADPTMLETLARVVPVRSSFTFQSPMEARRANPACSTHDICRR